MNQSFRIGTVFGITVRVHALLLVLVAFFLIQNPRSLTESLLLVATLATTIFLHELGHGLVAQHHGIKVLDITFWPLGGLARMSAIPQDWKVESQIAFAGPAVNFLLAGLALPVAFLLGMESGVGGYAFGFCLINLVLGVFNLIPAFPMDGARVLRALLARSGDWLQATERVASIGRGLAFFLALAGLILPIPGGCLMSFLFAGYIWWACTQEVLTVRMRNMSEAFGGEGGPFGGRNPFGFGAQEPASESASESRPGGFSTKDVEDLENFRGSLRQRKTDA